MAYQLWMRSLLNRMKELYGHTEAKTIAEALPDGDFFVIKGSVATAGDLPSSGNRVGDIYIVSEDGSEHIWVTNTTCPNGYWEQLGTEGVTAASVASAIDDMTEQQASTTLGNLGGEPKKMVVTVRYDNGNNAYTADKTFAEIKAAYIAGKTIVVKYSDMEYTFQDLIYEGSSFGQAYFAIYTFSNFNHSGRMRRIGVEQNGEHEDWSYNEILLEEKSEVYEDNSSVLTITPEENYIYNCTAAALTSLTITNPPATGSYVIKFNSGSTATTTTIPSSIHGLESFAAEANTHYEINVEDNYAVIGKWAISV